MNLKDVWDYIINKTKEIEQKFLEGKDEEIESLLMRFRNIASASPGNINAARAVEESLSESLISAVIEKCLLGATE